MSDGKFTDAETTDCHSEMDSSRNSHSTVMPDDLESAREQLTKESPPRSTPGWMDADWRTMSKELKELPTDAGKTEASLTSESADGQTEADESKTVHRSPFDQRNIVGQDTRIIKSHPARWWRSISPGLEAYPDLESEAPDASKSSTRGVLGFGKRTGPGCFQTQYQMGSGTAAHYKDSDKYAKTISGYSGFIAGKYAGNPIGGTFEATNKAAEAHLQETMRQTLQRPATSQADMRPTLQRPATSQAISGKYIMSPRYVA